MSRRALPLVVAGFAMTLAACEVHRALSAMTRGDFGPALTVVHNSTQRVDEHEKCAALSKRPVPLKEEVAFGGALAVGLIQRTNGLFVQLTPAQTKQAPDELRKRAQVKIADAPENELNQYLNVVGKNLAAQSVRPTLEWTFGVIDSAAINAFSAPGGYVLVTRGLLRSIDNEAQLAGVLAHEIAHVTQGHALKAYRATKSTQCDFAMGRGLLEDNSGGMAQSVERGVECTAKAVMSLQRMADPAQAGSVDLDDTANHQDVLKLFVDKTIDFILERGFLKDDEFEADRVGLELVVNAGYRPGEYISFLSKLPESRDVFPNHPPKVERQKRLEDWVEQLKNSDFLVLQPPPKEYPVVPLKNELAAAR